MNVLTLTTKDQVDEYSRFTYKLLREGNYDKVVFDGITGLWGFEPGYYGSEEDGVTNVHYLNYVPEIEVRNCTIDGDISIYNVKTPLKITIKDSTIQGFYLSDIHTSISVEMDNVTHVKANNSIYATIKPSSGSYSGDKSSLVFKNSKLNIQQLRMNLDTCDIELSNNHDMVVLGLPVDCIPDNATEQSTFLSQFTALVTNVMPSKIDEFNYKFDQADWDKLILLLDSYPNLFKTIRFDESFTDLLRLSNDDMYIHIPSLTFPLSWIGSLDYTASSNLTHYRNSLFAKDCVWSYVNKNNGHNFTITHIDKYTNWNSQYKFQGLLIADNYDDIIAAQPAYVISNSCYTMRNSYPLISFFNILSGKMVTTEITLMPNTYFHIRTIGSDMKIKRIKEVTRFHGKTIKVTGMEPFMLLSVAGTKCLDIDDTVEIDRAGSEIFLDGSITVKLLCVTDIDGDTNIQQKTYTDITGSVVINQIDSFIDGDVSIEAVLESIMEGTVSAAIPNREVDITGDIVVPGIEKIITGTIDVQPIVSTTITGEIAINRIDYGLDGSFQLAQAVSTDIIGDIEVRVCRVEILGYFEIPMEEVWG